MKDMIYTNQCLAELERIGCYKSAAGSHTKFFKELFASCKQRFKEAKFIANASYNGIGEFIYLPKGERLVLRYIKYELHNAKRSMSKLTIALDKMHKRKAQCK